MRALVLTLASAVALTGSCADAAPDRAQPAVATLRIVSERPFVLAGAGFRPYERVRLLISADGPAMRTVRAGRRGRFRVALPVSLPRGCGGLVIQALGARGSRAQLDRPGTDCAPTG